MSSATSESVFAITRLLMNFQPLPAPYSRIESDVATHPAVMGQVGPVALRNLDEIIVPYYPVQVELALKGVTDEEMTTALFKAMDNELMRRFIEMLDLIVLADHTIIEHEGLSFEMLNYSFAVVEEHELVASYIIISPSDYKVLTAPDNVEEFMNLTPTPKVWSADVIVHDAVPAGRVYVLPAPGFLGCFCPFEPKITVIDGPKGYKVGTITLDCGMAVINDYSFTRIIIDPESPTEITDDEQHAQIVAAVNANPDDLALRKELAESMVKPLFEESTENNYFWIDNTQEGGV